MSLRSAKHFEEKTGNRSTSANINVFDPRSNMIERYEFYPNGSRSNSPKTPQRFKSPRRGGFDRTKEKSQSPKCYACGDPSHYSNNQICYYFKFKDNPGREKCSHCNWVHKSSNCKKINGGTKVPKN